MLYLVAADSHFLVKRVWRCGEDLTPVQFIKRLLIVYSVPVPIAEPLEQFIKRLLIVYSVPRSIAEPLEDFSCEKVLHNTRNYD